MSKIGKTLALLLTLMVTMSCLAKVLVKPANAQTIPALSAPKFTVKFVDTSYSVPATYGTDPYTGKTVITSGGYYVQNKSIELLIINQVFTPYTDSNGNYVSMYYNVSLKGHFGNDWAYYDYYQGYWYANDGYQFLQATNQSTTTLTFEIDGNNDTSYQLPYSVSLLNNYQANSQLDFRVQANVAYFTYLSNPIIASPTYSPYRIVMNTLGVSDWSSTQSVTIGVTSTSPNPTQSSTNTISPTPTPTIPEYTVVAILPLLLATPLIALVLLRKKRS
jgi:hypothetical protein